MNLLSAQRKTRDLLGMKLLVHHYHHDETAHLEAFERAEGTGLKGILQEWGVSYYRALCHFSISKFGSMHEVSIPCHILRGHL